jgi:hypothetical protein
MNLKKEDKNKAVYEMQQEDGTNITFTLLNMGEYVGYNSRDWYEEAPECWETMFIDVDSEEPKKKMHCEFLIDSTGSLMRSILIDGQKIQRTRIYYTDSPNCTKEDEKRCRGEGISKINNQWVQDTIIKGDILEPGYESYYYDDETGKFLDEYDTSRELPHETLLSDYGIVDKFTEMRKLVAKEFSKSRNQKEKPNNIPDVEGPEL